ncbi:MAG: hypothetical protein IPK24_23815 [Kineosporiaceae bacterium]|nr:hypothetical protein [Kineosporiaceae bacterium]
MRYLAGPVGPQALLDRLPSPPPQVNRSIEVRYDPRKPDSVSASGVGLFRGGTVAIAVAFVIIGSVVLQQVAALATTAGGSDCPALQPL